MTLVEIFTLFIGIILLVCLYTLSFSIEIRKKIAKSRTLPFICKWSIVLGYMAVHSSSIVRDQKLSHVGFGAGSGLFLKDMFPHFCIIYTLSDLAAFPFWVNYARLNTLSSSFGKYEIISFIFWSFLFTFNLIFILITRFPLN